MTKKKLRAVSDVSMRCRDYRHAWEPYDGWREGRGWVRILECSRCTSKRVEELNYDGSKKKKPRINYAENFLVTGGRLTEEEKNAMRLRNIENMVAESKGKK